MLRAESGAAMTRRATSGKNCWMARRQSWSPSFRCCSTHSRARRSSSRTPRCTRSTSCRHRCGGGSVAHATSAARHCPSRRLRRCDVACVKTLPRDAQGPRQRSGACVQSRGTDAAAASGVGIADGGTARCGAGAGRLHGTRIPTLIDVQQQRARVDILLPASEAPPVRLAIVDDTVVSP